MNTDKLIGLLKGIAPAIAGALGGPFAAAGVSALEEALGISPDPEKSQDGRISELAARIQGATAADLLALKEADLHHAETMAKIAGDDRKSARDREIAVKDVVPGLLAFCVTAGFFGVLGYMLGYEVPASNRDVLNILLGSLGTAWVSVVAYYYGKSSDDGAKAVMLYNSTPKDK